MEPGKKQYKILITVPKKGGGTYWMRVGAGFTNRDNSINLVIDAMPAPQEQCYKLQLRELDAEDLRRRESYNAGSNRSGNSFGSSNSFGSGGHGGSADAPTDDANRFALRDLGGIGGGPTTRAITASTGGLDADGIPF